MTLDTLQAQINAITHPRLTVTLTPTSYPLRFTATMHTEQEEFKAEVWYEPWVYESGRAIGFELLREWEARLRET